MFGACLCAVGAFEPGMAALVQRPDAHAAPHTDPNAAPPRWAGGSLLPAPLVWSDWYACVRRVAPDVDHRVLRDDFAAYWHAADAVDQAARLELARLDAIDVRSRILSGTLASDDPRPGMIDRQFRILDAATRRARRTLERSLAAQLRPEDCDPSAAAFADAQASEAMRAWQRRVVINNLQPPGTIDWSRIPDLDAIAATAGSPLHTVLSHQALSDEASQIWSQWDVRAAAITDDVFQAWSVLMRRAWTEASQGRNQPVARLVGKPELRLWELARDTMEELAQVAVAHGAPQLAADLQASFRKQACPHVWGAWGIDHRMETLARADFPADVSRSMAEMHQAWLEASTPLRVRAEALAWWDQRMVLTGRVPASPPDQWVDINRAFLDATLATADAVQALIGLELFSRNARQGLTPEQYGPARPPRCLASNGRWARAGEGVGGGEAMLDGAKRSYRALFERNTHHAEKPNQ